VLAAYGGYGPVFGGTGPGFRRRGSRSAPCDTHYPTALAVPYPSYFRGVAGYRAMPENVVSAGQEHLLANIDVGQCRLIPSG
jgi:hypothetical protein